MWGGEKANANYYGIGRGGNLHSRSASPCRTREHETDLINLIIQHSCLFTHNPIKYARQGRGVGRLTCVSGRPAVTNSLLAEMLPLIFDRQPHVTPNKRGGLPTHPKKG